MRVAPAGDADKTDRITVRSILLRVAPPAHLRHRGTQRGLTILQIAAQGVGAEVRIWTMRVDLLSTNMGVSMMWSMLVQGVPVAWKERIMWVCLRATVSLLSRTSNPLIAWGRPGRPRCGAAPPART